MTLSAAEIKAALAERIEQLVEGLLPNAYRDGRCLRVGSVRGEAGQSLAIYLDGSKRGRWSDFATGEYGDALDLVNVVLDKADMTEAMDWAEEWLAAQPAERVATAAGKRCDPESSAAQLARLLTNLEKITPDSIAARYLTARAISIKKIVHALTGLRWRQSVAYWVPPKKGSKNKRHRLVGHWPALIAPVVAVDKRTIAAQVTYLQRDGSGKLHHSHPDRPGKLLDARKTYGSPYGGAVRLAAVDTHLVLAEGVEDALAIIQTTGRAAWACLGTSGLVAVHLPDAVTTVTIAADADEAGERVAQQLAKRLVNEGRKVSIARPPAGFKDFNEALMVSRRRGKR